MKSRIPFSLLVVLLSTWFSTMTHADGPRVLPRGKLPVDTRLGPLRGERGNFHFEPAKSRKEWQDRAARVRQMMLVSMGLWPMPTKTPLRPVLHGKIDRGDYTVEKVFFESLPGFFVTGNLYRPKGKSGKLPAVLSPHGHFSGGRFIDEGKDAVRWKIAKGAERFEEGGRSFMQSRCVQLARMGCVVFHYDMIGYGDSVQIPLDVAHRFSRLREKINTPPEHGFYSADALLRLQNPLGLHTWNSIRALDFLTSLPDVDSKRIAVTGGSGGGTQTFLLCAVDDRPLVSVPVVIVSTTRQGGCTCENICGFRIGTNNLEFTALHAPKPLLLISADDATRTMAQMGFPELKRHYEILQAGENVAHKAFLHFPHNYNAVSRTAMYHWLNKHFQLEWKEPILERPYIRLSKKEMTVWGGKHPKPPAGPEFEKKLFAYLTDDAQTRIAKLTPSDEASLQRYRQIVGGAWDILLRKLPSSPQFQFAQTKLTNNGDYSTQLGLLRYGTVENHHAELPVVRLVPKQSKGRTVVRIHSAGKSGLFQADGTPGKDVMKLLKAKYTVIGVDLLQQGEFRENGNPLKRQRFLPNEDAFAGWTYCYNLPLFAKRVHDVLAVITWVKKDDPKAKIDVVGMRGAGHWVAAAVAQSDNAVDRVVIDTAGFRFAKLKDVYDVHFQPGAAKYNDLPGLLSLIAPAKLWLAGEDEKGLRLIRAAYRASGQRNRLTIYTGDSSGINTAAYKWLTDSN